MVIAKTEPMFTCPHACVNMFACVCVCVCVCVQPNPIGRVYFVAGRGKQMAGCVAELYGVQHTHTHTHTHTHMHTHKERERDNPGWIRPTHHSAPSAPQLSHRTTQNHTNSLPSIARC